MANYDLAYPGAAIDAILTTAYDLQNAGYIFKGSATNWSGTPTQRTWLLAPAGFSGYGFSSAIPKGSIGICKYNGSAWSGDVINVVTIDSTVTNGSTNPVSGDAVWDAMDELATGIRDTLLSFTITDGTASADQASKLTYDVKMTDGQGVLHLIGSFNILAATAYKAGLMSAADKAKVDAFLDNLRSLSFTDTTPGADVGTKIVETLKMTVGGVQEAVTALTILAATTSKAGLMSAADKTYLDGIPSSLSTINTSISKLLAMLGYYECSTAAGTAAKTVSASGYVLTTGGCIRIKMTNANTADSVTLNINGTGAKNLYYNGEQASSLNSWDAGDVLEVYYDGTQYQCASGGGGGKFATGQKVEDTSISTEFANSDALLRSADAYTELYEQVADGTINVKNTYTFTTGKYINTSGADSSGAGSWRMTTNFIQIGANWLSVTIGATAGTTSGLAVAFYSSNSESSFISGSPCTVETTVQIPANARYVRFCKANSDDVHTINLYAWQSKITLLDNKIDGVQTEMENGYEKVLREINYSSQIVTGKAYNTTAIGASITSVTNASFSSIRIPCKKGDIFAIKTKGLSNIKPVIVGDADEKALYYLTNSNACGGVFEVGQEGAAYLYVSGYTSLSMIKKLPYRHDDTIIVDDTYADASMMPVTGSAGTYNGYYGFCIPFLMKKGDVAKVKFRSFNNYRGYLIADLTGVLKAYLSDTDLTGDIMICNNTDSDFYMYVNGKNTDGIRIQKYATTAAFAMKNHGKRMYAMGDSITSYDASDIGEFVRGELGMSFPMKGTQVDFGNLAEGLATICNWEDTTQDFTHSGTAHNRTLPNEVLKLLQFVTPLGEQISWTIKSNNTTYTIDTTVATGLGGTTEIPDLIFIAMGTNDSVITDDFDTVVSQNYGNLTKLTICSSLRWCLETLQNKFPEATIVCVTPIKRGTRTVAEQEAKRDLIIKMCNYMAIPVVDGYNISGYSPYTYGIYSSDQIHPNTFTQRIARSIAAQVNALT